MKCSGIIGFLLLVCVTCLAQASEPITFNSLLMEMVDRDSIARWPEPAYTCKQFSSYDRQTVSPDQPGWFANWDRSQFVRIEEVDGRKEYVMMDAEGPGAVVRIWATWHGPRGQPFSNGTIRFYLDGSDTPAIEGPISEVIDGGALVGPPLAEGVAAETEYGKRGHNLYLPIPYAKHCKITYSTDVPVDVGGRTGEALYYQINYRTYEEGSEVKSFSMAQLEAHKEAIDKLQFMLKTPEYREQVPEIEVKAGHREIRGGAQQSLSFTGPAAIHQIKFHLTAKNMEQALRSTLVEISFDGEPAVVCPIGDFFGIGYQMREVKTWYTKVDAGGTMTSLWVMPFKERCDISFTSLMGELRSPEEVAVWYEIRTKPWDWDDNSMHFHAAWRLYPEVDTGESKSMDDAPGVQDMNFVTVQGKGVYVGDSLVIFNGTDSWWGEGDEKIYVDGETFPSHVGTGTEDYYGYAWCRSEAFSSPFHAQPEGGGNMQPGYSVNSRYRALDAIPFTKSIKFDMELWHWGVTKVDYSPTTIWYAKPGATSNIKPEIENAGRTVTLHREQIVKPLKVPGAIEGESMQVVQANAGRANTQSGMRFNWSGDEQLWWMDANVSDKLEVTFDVEQAGRYDVLARLTTANDYGIIKISINGKTIDPIDLYATRVINTSHELGTFDLKQGPNTMVVEIVGMNSESTSPRHGFGLDYLLLTRKTR